MDVKHIIIRHIWSAFLLVGLVFLAEACGPAATADAEKPGDFPDDSKLARVVSIVRTPSTSDTVFASAPSSPDISHGTFRRVLLHPRLRRG